IISFCSVPKISFASDEIDKTLRAMRLIERWSRGNSSLAPVAPSEGNVVWKPKISKSDLSHDDISSYLKSISDFIHDRLTVNANIEADLILLQWSERFVSSEGSNVIQNYPYTILTITVRVKKNNQFLRYYKSYGGLGGFERIPYSNYDVFNDFIEVVNNLPSARAVRRGKYPSVLSEDMTWTCLHEVLGHSLEGDNVLSGRSFSAGMLGMKIAPSFVSVIDDPFIETVGFYEYDSEGVKGKGTLLVEEGILTDFLHSRETAAAMDAEPSGNYRAFGFEFLPQVRMSNIFLEPKDFTTEELLESVKNGLFIGDSLGGSSEPQTGEYNLDAQYGRIIKNGELSDYVVQFQVSGNMLETLSHLIGVGNQLQAQPSSCIKNYQRIFVGSVSPKVAVSELKVS
ncbi:MAG: TldD/PmbA family protein, partial [Candidatus Heimdallarchaeaceae archaeon]